MLSSCCKALVTDHLSQTYPVRTSDELRGKTYWHICTKCGEACDLQPPAEDKNGHKIGKDGELIYDERCRTCDAPKPPAESHVGCTGTCCWKTGPKETPIRELIARLEELKSKKHNSVDDGEGYRDALVDSFPVLAESLRLALDGLEKLSCLGNGDRPGNSNGNVIAQDTLAQIQLLTPQHEAL